MEAHASLSFDTHAMSKDINADIALAPDDASFSVKFHVRPLHEVCAFEKGSGHVVPVPDGMSFTCSASRSHVSP